MSVHGFITVGNVNAPVELLVETVLIGMGAGIIIGVVWIAWGIWRDSF